MDGRESSGLRDEVPPPPRIADTDEWAHRVCFLMADVTVIHSVLIRATGSIATETVGALPKSGGMLRSLSGMDSWGGLMVDGGTLTGGVD